MKHYWMSLLLLSSLALSPAATAGSMRCGSALISEGDSAARLITICGEPVYRDVWSPFVLADGVLASTEEWYYNFGPSQFMRIVRLHAGRIEEIESDGYGFVEPPAPSCGPGVLAEGLSKFRLLLACGEPLTRRAINAYLPYNHGYNDWVRRRGVFTRVYREEWSYGAGTGRFMRVITLENGRIVDVRQTTGGFD